MEFRYGSSFGVEPPEAYERLILDCLLGDGTLFTRADEVEASWTWISKIHQHWQAKAAAQAAAGAIELLPTYAAGSWGPEASDQLIGVPAEAPVAEALSVRRRADSVAKFSRGEAITVEVDRIEKALASLWQAASRGEDGGETQPISRAALWNLVIPARGIDSLSRVKRLVDDLAPAMPARVITLVPRAGATPLAGISATIESNVVSRAGRRAPGLRRGDHAHRRGRRGRRAPLRRARARAADPQPADGDAVVRRLARRQPAQQRAPAGLRPPGDRHRPLHAARASSGRALLPHARDQPRRGRRPRLAAPRGLPPAVRGPVRPAGGRRPAAGGEPRRDRAPRAEARRARSCWRPGWASQLGWRPLDATPGSDRGPASACASRPPRAATGASARSSSICGRRRASAARAASCRWRSTRAARARSTACAAPADNHAELTVPIAPPRT